MGIAQRIPTILGALLVILAITLSVTVSEGDGHRNDNTRHSGQTR